MKAAMLTVPERLEDMGKTMFSLSQAGFPFDECKVFNDEGHLGEYWNARRALTWLYEQGDEYSLMCEDDCVFKPEAGEKLNALLTTRQPGLVSLILMTRDGHTCEPNVWSVAPFPPYGTQAFVIRRDVLHEVLLADFWESPTQHESLDVDLFGFVMRMGNNIWLHKPSLVHHTRWNETTLQGKPTPNWEDRQTC